MNKYKKVKLWLSNAWMTVVQEAGMLLALLIIVALIILSTILNTGK